MVAYKPPHFRHERRSNRCRYKQGRLARPREPLVSNSQTPGKQAPENHQTQQQITTFQTTIAFDQNGHHSLFSILIFLIRNRKRGRQKNHCLKIFKRWSSVLLHLMGRIRSVSGSIWGSQTFWLAVENKKADQKVGFQAAFKWIL